MLGLLGTGLECVLEAAGDTAHTGVFDDRGLGGEAEELLEAAKQECGLGFAAGWNGDGWQGDGGHDGWFKNVLNRRNITNKEKNRQVISCFILPIASQYDLFSHERAPLNPKSFSL